MAGANNGGRCPCGLYGELLGHPDNNPYSSTEGFYRIQSINSDMTHDHHTWHCYECRRSHGECLTTNRQSPEQESHRCGYDSGQRFRESLRS